MDNGIKISKFYITAPGDESVGIFPATWTLSGDFIFDCDDDVTGFKNDITLAFEQYCGEKVHIMSEEEINKMEK